MMQVSIEDAYREACMALGETIVRERLLTAELARREHEAAPPPTKSTPSNPPKG